MACAQGSRSSLSYITEVTKGVTPAGNKQAIPFSTHSLNVTKETVEGTDILPHSQQTVSRHGNKQVGGDIVVDLRTTVYDDFLESALMNVWTSDVLKLGNTPKYFSIEDYATDIDQARLFTGCTVSSVAISMAPNQMITTTFTIVGEDGTISQTESTTDAVVNAQPFDSYSGTLSLGDAGGTLTEVGEVTSLEFTVDNVVTPTFVIGSNVANCLSFGTKSVTGTMTVLYEDAAFLNRFLNEVESAFQVTVNDPTGSNEYAFDFYRVKFNTGDVPVTGGEIRSVSISFTALYDEAEETTMAITRPTTP